MKLFTGTPIRAPRPSLLSRSRRRGSAIPWLPALLLLLSGLPLLTATAAFARSSVVWLLVDTRGRDGEDVRLRVPLEWVRRSGEMTWCDDEKDPKSIRGPELYEKYKDLPPGEERRVESTDCEEGKVEVRVRCDRIEPGAGIRRFRIRVRGHGESGDDMDFAVTLDALTSLKNFFSGNWIGFGDEDDVKAVFDQDPEGLRSLPPFELLKARGDDGGTVVIRAES